MPFLSFGKKQEAPFRYPGEPFDVSSSGALLKYWEFHEIAVWLTQTLTPKGEKNKALEFALAVDGRPYLFRAYCPDNYRQIWLRVGDDQGEHMVQEWQKTGVYLRQGNWFKVGDHDSCWREAFRLNTRLISHLSDQSTICLKEIRWGDLPPATGPYGRHEVGEQLAPLPERVDLSGATSLYDLMVRLVGLVYQSGDDLTLTFKGVTPQRNIVDRLVVPGEREWLVAAPGPKWQERAKRIVPTPEALHAAMGKREWHLGSVRHWRPNVTLL